MDATFWAVIGVGATLFIGLGGLLLMVTSWQRADMRDVRNRVDDLSETVAELRGWLSRDRAGVQS